MRSGDCVANRLCLVEGAQAVDRVGNETILGREFGQIRINGRPVGESEIDVATCGPFGAPVVFASGDDLYERELRRTLPDVEFGFTKYALDRWIGGKVAPYALSGAVELTVTSSSMAEALMGSLVPGSVRRSPREVAYTANGAVAAWKGFSPCCCSAGPPPTRSTANATGCVGAEPHDWHTAPRPEEPGRSTPKSDAASDDEHGWRASGSRATDRHAGMPAPAVLWARALAARVSASRRCGLSPPGSGCGGRRRTVR